MYSVCLHDVSHSLYVRHNEFCMVHTSVWTDVRYTIQSFIYI